VKLFDLDWREFFACLPAWEGVSLAARRAFLAVKPSEVVAAASLGAHREALVAAGLVAPVGDGRRLQVLPPARPFLRALRAMHRHPLFDGPAGEQVLGSYLAEHFTHEEQEAFGRTVNRYGRLASAREIGQRSWLDGFLAADDPQAWAYQRSSNRGGPSSELWKLLGVPAIAAGTRALVRLLVDSDGPIPARDLPERAEARPEELAPALLAALRFAVVFAGLRQADLEPLFGVWPEIHARAHRPRVPPPQPVQPREVFPEALGLGDLTTVLAALAAAPARLRQNDHRLFVHDRREIEQRLQPAPALAEEQIGLSPEVRVELALVNLHGLRFIGDQGRRHDRLGATKTGLAWLGRPDAERLRALLDSARRSLRAERRPGGWRPTGLGFWPRRLGYLGEEDHAALVAPLARAFLAAGEGVFVSTTGFLSYQAREENPLPDLLADGSRSSYWYLPPDEQQLERGWLDLLRYFLMERLVAFGGARLGHAGADGFCFALTSAGSYLLGAADDFTWSSPAVPDGQVVVQPNFEIVFLGPSPAAEAVAGRFAERIAAGGERVGTLYRLTRDAVFAAASTGATAEQAVDALAGLSSRPLPANVERQLGDWFGACRTVRAAPTLLLRCPDPETAARVRAALGRGADLLGDTAVAAPGDRLTAAVRNKLRKAGIFLEKPPEPEDEALVDDLEDLAGFDDDLDDDIPY
jgi:hypothetical protein